MRCVTVVLLVSGLCVAPSEAQPVRTSVAITHSGEDELGRSFVSHVKEVLRQSTRFSSAEAEQDGDLTLRISTLNPTPQRAGAQSVLSWSLTVTKRNDAYLSGGVQSFGADRVKDAANALLVTVDSIASRHREEIPSSTEAQESERSWNAAVEGAAEKIRLDGKRKLFLQHMELQRRVFQLSGFLLPAEVSELAGSVAAEYDESDKALLNEELSACRLELATLKKRAKGPKR